MAKITAPSARWSVCVQAERRVITCRPPTITWIAKRTAAPTANRTNVGSSRCVRHATTASVATITPTTAATQRCSTCGDVRSFSAGTSVPFISGQSGKTRAVSVAVTCDPNSRSANVASVVKAANSVKRWLAPPEPRRAGKPARTVTMVDPGEDRQPEDLEPDDGRDRPMDPLDPCLGVVQGRQDLTMTERPVRTAEPRVRGSHDHADRHERQRRRERDRGESLEAGQGVSWARGTGGGRDGKRADILARARARPRTETSAT